MTLKNKITNLILHHQNFQPHPLEDMGWGVEHCKRSNMRLGSQGFLRSLSSQFHTECPSQILSSKWRTDIRAKIVNFLNPSIVYDTRGLCPGCCIILMRSCPAATDS